MFKRDHHLRIAAVLRALDAELLASLHCYFGGGTAIALQYGEYRESVGIDFMVFDKACYRALRQRLGEEGLGAILREPLKQTRELRSDQYGIRTLIEVGSARIKFEIVREARIEFQAEGGDTVCGIRTLSRLDQVASKMLANSDRWADASSFSRDLIDLAILGPESALVGAALKKAGEAYGELTLRRDLSKAFTALKENPERLDLCLKQMKMTIPKAVLWAKIRDLLSRVPPLKT